MAIPSRGDTWSCVLCAFDQQTDGENLVKSGGCTDTTLESITVYMRNNNDIFGVVYQPIPKQTTCYSYEYDYQRLLVRVRVVMAACRTVRTPEMVLAPAAILEPFSVPTLGKSQFLRLYAFDLNRTFRTRKNTSTRTRIPSGSTHTVPLRTHVPLSPRKYRAVRLPRLISLS